MKRFKIEICKTGVTIYDRLQKIYLLDASTIETDLLFTIHKGSVTQRKTLWWENKHDFYIKKNFRSY